MPLIAPRGSPAAKIWILLEKPFASDIPKGYLCSGPMGYAFEKILEEGGLKLSDCYFISRFPDTSDPLAAQDLDNALRSYKPPLILMVGATGWFFLNELKPSSSGESYKTALSKYVGSLLQNPSWSWSHYAMPLWGPEDLMADWRERNVTVYIDIAKLKDEFEYWRANGTVRPLRSRDLRYEMDTDELLKHLDDFRSSPIQSLDIETVYPRKGSVYYQKHPGIPIVFGIAISPEFAISFNSFRSTPAETRAVWRAMDKLHSNGATIVGQNFFAFDSCFYNMMGFSLPKEKFQDTLIRHHILWPELPHSLQFLTRQYTRQPFYKDEGQGWNMKNMNGLRHYNCLDCTVTFEVYEAQEQEFLQRPHLR